MNSTEHRYEIASQLGIPNEYIGMIQQIDDCLYFNVNGAEYAARLTKTGRVKRNSVRKQ